MYRLVFSMLSLLCFLVSAAYSQTENCNNNIDDDGNGFTDCEDRACFFDAEACPAYHMGAQSCPVAGELPDITGSALAFKDDNLSLDTMALALPPATTSARLVIQGNYEGVGFTETITPNVGFGNDRLIYGIVDVDLESKTSTGMVEYLVNNSESRRYVWENQALGQNSADFVRQGGVLEQLTDFEFEFGADDTKLWVIPSQTNIQLSVFSTFFGNQSESMVRVQSEQKPFLFFPQATATIEAEHLRQGLALEDSVAFISIKSIGINLIRNTDGASLDGWQEEGNLRQEILIDMEDSTAKGIVTLSNGIDSMAGSNYTFENYSMFSGGRIIESATITGDTTGVYGGLEQQGLVNSSIQFENDSLIIHRNDTTALSFNEIYIVEFLKRTGLPYNSGFSVLRTLYVSPQMHGHTYTTTDYVDLPLSLDIPAGSRTATFLTTGNGLFQSLEQNPQGPSSSNYLNENQIITYANINLVQETHSGYNAFLATDANQQTFAWQDAELNLTNDYTTGDITGQAPVTADRVFFGMADNKLEMTLRNSQWAFQRNLLVRFEGALPDLIPGRMSQNTTKESCDSLFFDFELCNGGANVSGDENSIDISLVAHSEGGEAVVLSTVPLAVTLAPGKCGLQTQSFEKNLIPSSAERVTLEVNYGNSASLDECSFTNNQDSSFYRLPVIVEGAADVGDIPVCRVPPGFIHSSEMHDDDEDGIPDLLIVRFERNLDIDGLPDTLMLEWGLSLAPVYFTKEEIEEGQNGLSEVHIRQNFTTRPISEGEGTTSAKQGDEPLRSVPVLDKMGPFLTSALLKTDTTGVADTLRIRFSEPVLQSSLISPFVAVNSALTEHLELEQVDDYTWHMVLPAGTAVHGDRLQLNEEVVRDLFFNLVGYNPEVRILEEGRVLSVSTDGNLFQDINEDGTMDQVQITLEKAIDTAKILPWKIHVEWPDENGDLKVIEFDETLWEEQEDLVYTVDLSDSALQALQTSLIQPETKTAKLIVDIDSTYKDTLTFSMGDGMAPVPIEARITKEKEADTVKVTYTEVVEVPVEMDSLYNLFINGSYALSHHMFAGIIEEPEVVTLIYRGGEELFPGDSIQANAFSLALADTLGNEITENSQWREITGPMPMGFELGELVEIDNSILDSSSFGLELIPRTITLSELEEDASIQGVLVSGRMLDLFGEVVRNLPEEIVENIEPKDMSVNYKIWVYTNIGQYVAGIDGTIGCDDERFNGNCNSPVNSSNILIRWNQQSDAGRLAGTGAYIIAYKLTAQLLDYKKVKDGHYTVGVRRK